MRDLIKLELPEEVWPEIHTLYFRMGWEQLDHDGYATFEDVSALFFRVNYHMRKITTIPPALWVTTFQMLLYTLQQHLASEATTDPTAPRT